jgi:glycosyltransferase involved in cell wall biosynthesis
VNRPLVSVIVDTYNHESFIETAIASVLDQDIGRRSFEVIVVDDGSTDGTAAVVERFGGDVSFIRKKNGGQASAFNVGIPSTSGQIIAFLDGDDWWELDKLSTVVSELEKDRALGAVGHGLIEHRGDSTTRRTAQREIMLQLRSAEDVLPFLNHKSYMGTCQLTARRWALEPICPIPDALVVEADEYLFTLVVATTGVRVLPTALNNYRMHDGNLFQFDSLDPVKRARKQKVLAALAIELRSALRECGLSEDVVADVLLPLEVDAERLRLALLGGTRRETMKTERAGRTVARMFGAPLRPAVRVASPLLAVALPPRRFYQLRDWYARARRPVIARRQSG